MELGMKKIGVYALSGNPFTYGHKHIVDKGLSVFDEIMILICGENELDLNNKKTIAKSYFYNNTNVKIRTHKGALTNYMKYNNYKYLIRGIRDGVDYNYEKNLYDVYKNDYPMIEVIYLFCDNIHTGISSSTVRELIKYNKDISRYTNYFTSNKLRYDNKSQRIALTGESGSGKSKIMRYIKNHMNICKLDDIGRKIISDKNIPLYYPCIQEMKNTFSGKFNLTYFRNEIIKDKVKLNIFNSIMNKYIKLYIEDNIKQTTVYETALVLDHEELNYFDNNLLFILGESDNNRNNYQLRYIEKLNKLYDVLEKDSHLNVTFIDNRYKKPFDRQYIKKKLNLLQLKSHRISKFYHNETHVENMLGWLEKEFPEHSDNSILVQAIHYHDIVFNTLSSDHVNVKNSAKRCLKDTRSREAYDLILCTNHSFRKKNLSNLEKVLIDLDYSIFAEKLDMFLEYDIDIRREFMHIQEEEFYKKRFEFLSYLLTTKIFKTEQMSKYENKAKENIEFLLNNIKRYKNHSKEN